MPDGKVKRPAPWSRFFRRLWRPFLDAKEKALISAAIAEMEARTTGEIHVHVIGRAGGDDILDYTRKKFMDLGLDKTAGRNGVLILVSHLDHQFAIWGDEAVNAKAGQALWPRAAEVLKSHLAQGRHGEAIEACVREVGQELAAHFPQDKPGPEPNQLSNEVSES